MMTLLLATFHWLTQPEHWLGDEGILLRLGQHLYYVLVSMAVACAIALPLGIASGYWRKGAFVVINLFNLGRAIPSLGLILLCIIVFGFNDIPVLAALIALSIPPILTNTWVGIYHADRPLCDAAIALGMTLAKPVAGADPAGGAADPRRSAHRAGSAYRHGGGRSLCRSGRVGTISDRRTRATGYPAGDRRLAGGFLLAIGGELLFARCAGRLVHRRIAAPY